MLLLPSFFLAADVVVAVAVVSAVFINGHFTSNLVVDNLFC